MYTPSKIHHHTTPNHNTHIGNYRHRKRQNIEEELRTGKRVQNVRIDQSSYRVRKKIKKTKKNVQTNEHINT